MELKIDTLTLHGDLTTPKDAHGIVIFAHGSGSSRLSPRNRFVAEYMNKAGLATLLFDLLTEEEEKIDNVTRELRFNIDLLATRLLHVAEYVATDEKTKGYSIGYFGASTGAAAALIAAAKNPKPIHAIVSRGGRPDLAGQYLSEVEAATLLIVGGDDTPVIEMNEEALTLMQCEKKLEIVPGATHLFEEKGKLEVVAKLATSWFQQHL